MADIFGGPGVSRTPVTFNSNNTDSGVITVKGPGIEINGLIQNWSGRYSERVQEVLTLSDTQHIYTFGNILPKLSISSYVIGAKFGSDKYKNNYKSKDLLASWRKIRARTSGNIGKPNVSIYIEDLNKTFTGVATDLVISKDLSLEPLVRVDLQVIVFQDLT